MHLEESDVVALDECTLLHSCRLEVPPAFSGMYPGGICHRNCGKIRDLIDRLEKKGHVVYRFVPTNHERNIIRVVEGLLGETTIMTHVLKSTLLEQLYEYVEEVSNRFQEIVKDEDIGSYKRIFRENERELTKPRNIPEDDDLSVLAGYVSFLCGGERYLVSEDEHFWGYADLISRHWGVTVVKEWECHTLS